MNPLSSGTVTLFSNDGRKPLRSGDGRVLHRRRALLVATSLDEGGGVALRRAHVLSEVFSARLHVVHVPPSSAQLVVHERAAQDEVLRWAAEEAGIVLARHTIEIDIGDPATAIARAAKRTDAQLVVVGAPSAGAADAIATVGSLAGRLPPSSGLLVAHPPRTAGELVAATDLRDAQFPVVKTAAHLADALAARVTVVHNLESEGPVLALALENIADRLQELERLANELDRVHAGRVSTTRTTAEAIADVARSRDADIAVVGVRRGHGRTLLSLLGTATCSVLAIPLS